MSGLLNPSGHCGGEEGNLGLYREHNRSRPSIVLTQHFVKLCVQTNSKSEKMAEIPLFRTKTVGVVC
jgi:hypothetical protein